MIRLIIICRRISKVIIDVKLSIYNIYMKTADLLNEIINSVDRLIQNIRKLYSNIKVSLKMKKM